MARVIVADVATEKAEAVEANRHIDKRLARAEKMVTKSGKPKPVRSKRDAKQIEKALTTERVKMAQQFVQNLAISENPADREAARGLL